jgi:hypothetical protein
VQKYDNRVKVVELLIKVKRASKDPGSTKELEALEWIHKVLRHLKADGMSSEETDNEGVTVVYRVKVMPWRRQGVVDVMEIIDNHKGAQSLVWTPCGQKPAKRIRNNLTSYVSARRHVSSLPRALYDAEWLGKPSNSVTVNVSKEDFQWMQVLLCPLATE